MKRNSLVSDEALDPRRWWTLAVLCLSLLVIGLDNTILNVALPTLQRDLDASSSQLQWIVDIYMLVFAGVLLTAGSLGDRFGRKRALTLGLLVFGARFTRLRAGRLARDADRRCAALMGVGGALIMPSTLSILTATFPAHERGKAIGIWAGVSGLGIAIGPVTGGWLIEHANWSWIFLVNLPIVAWRWSPAASSCPRAATSPAPRLDIRGFTLSFAALSTLIWGLIEAPARGWTDGLVLAAFAFAALVLAAFVAWERRAPSPMLDIALFRNPRFSASSAAISLAFFALFGMIFFLTQYLQQVRGYSALDAGLRTMPVAAGLVLGGPLSAKLSEKLGIRLVVPAGMALVAVALWMLSFADAGSGYGLIAGALVLIGPRHGLGDGSGHRRDHGLAARGEDERRIGDQRHHAGRRRRAGRRGARIAPGQRLPWGHGLGRPVCPRRGRTTRSAARWRSASRRRPAAAAQDAFVSGMHTAALVAAGGRARRVVAAVFLPSGARAAPEACRHERREAALSATVARAAAVAA